MEPRPVPPGSDRTGPADDLQLAQQLADLADAISLTRFGASDLRVSDKPDMTPVSDADLAVESALRELIARERPGDRVVGEEFSDPAARSIHGRRWIIDPIDGTKSYVRGVPIWATLIGLVDGGEPVVGVASAPALSRRWWAARGFGSFTRFADHAVRRCRVSGVGRIEDASISYSEPSEWRAVDREDSFQGLLGRCWRTRAYGDFYSYMLVAEGAVDIAAEPELSLWDVAALGPIVTEAGGRFTGVDGRPAISAKCSALATNGLLHDDVLTALDLTN